MIYEIFPIFQTKIRKNQDFYNIFQSIKKIWRNQDHISKLWLNQEIEKINHGENPADNFKKDLDPLILKFTLKLKLKIYTSYNTES